VAARWAPLNLAGACAHSTLSLDPCREGEQELGWREGGRAHDMCLTRINPVGPAAAADVISFVRQNRQKFNAHNIFTRYLE